MMNEWFWAHYPLNMIAASAGATLTYNGVPYVCTLENGVHIYCDLAVFATSPTGVLFENGSYVRQDGGKQMHGSYRLILVNPEGKVESY